jgi:hypothetical protein
MSSAAAYDATVSVSIIVVNANHINFLCIIIISFVYGYRL